ASDAQPPFYLVAYALAGSTTVSPMLADGAALRWQVNLPAGSELLLGVVDSAGHSGGVANQTWTVADGDSAACLPPVPASAPAIAANVTRDLGACQPLGLTMRGGVPPYTVSVVSPGAGTVTNTTLGPGDDALAYVNPAAPN
ncbi:hypothetical protein FA95DRAFT_1465696, partial [Auriscalpium vulgare]